MNSAGAPHSHAAGPFGYSFYQNGGAASNSQPSIAPATDQAHAQAQAQAQAQVHSHAPTSGNPLLNNQEEDYINSFFMSHAGQEMSTTGFDLAIQQAADQLHGSNMTQFGWLMTEQPPTFVNASATPKQPPAPTPYQHMAHHGSIDFGHHFNDGGDLLSSHHYQHMLPQTNLAPNHMMGHNQVAHTQNTPSLVSAPSTEASDMLQTSDPLTGLPGSMHGLLNIIPGTTVTAHEVRDLLGGQNFNGTFNGLTPINTVLGSVRDDHMDAPRTAPARLDDMPDGRLYRFGSDSHFGLDGFKPSSVTQDHEFIANRLTEELHMLKPINRSNAPTRASSPSRHLSTHISNHERKRSSAHLDPASTKRPEVDDSNHISRPKKRRKDEAISDDEDAALTPAHKRKFSVPHPRMRRVSSTATGDLSPSSASKRRRSSVTASAGKASRENLSEEQKRSNHIQSEQKRRNLIKIGFDELRRIVPELRGGGLSKSMELTEVSNFLEQVIKANEALRARLGIQVPTKSG